jgi:hypothetical protein
MVKLVVLPKVPNEPGCARGIMPKVQDVKTALAGSRRKGFGFVFDVQEA